MAAKKKKSHTKSKSKSKKKKGKKKDPEQNADPVPLPRHLIVVARFGERKGHGDGRGTGPLLMAKPATRPPSKDAPEPRIDGSNWLDFRPGAGEIVLSYLDRDGVPLNNAALRGRSRAYVDRPEGRPGVRHPSPGRQIAPRNDDRLIHLTVQPDASYLLLLRTRVLTEEQAGAFAGHVAARGDGAFGPIAFGWEELGAYRLETPGKEDPPPTLPPIPFPLSGFDDPPTIEPMSTVSIPTDSIPVRKFQYGWVDSEETYVDNGAPEELFNIVITGDGFDENENTLFDDAAKTVIHGLFGGEDGPGIEPFAQLASRVNIRIVRAVSYNSGVTHGDDMPCREQTAERFTCYRVRGCFPVDDTEDSDPAYCGTDTPELIYDSARNFLPLEQVHLFLVIVNSKAPGGSAFPDQRIAFVTLGADPGPDPVSGPEYMVQIAAHEAAHVIGGLGDEYIAPVPWSGDPADLERNIAHRDQMNEIWWRPQAQNATVAVTTSPNFEIFDCVAPDASICRLDHNLPPQQVKNLSDNRVPRTLGLYWGAQYIDEDAAVDGNADNFNYWGDLEGRNFFRAMARCKMRHEKWEFCNVCSFLINKRILNP